MTLKSKMSIGEVAQYVLYWLYNTQTEKLHLHLSKRLRFQTKIFFILLAIN